MKSKSFEQENSSINEHHSKSSFQKLVSLMLEDWLPFSLAILITLLTIIVVPILYRIRDDSTKGLGQNLSWNSKGITLINKDIILNGINQTLGTVIALTYDLDDNLYLVEKSHHRILIFDKVNLSIRVGHLNASSNSNKYSLNSPNDCLVDANHHLYVADTMNHRIQLFERNSMEGITILGTGQSGSRTEELNQPMSVALDTSLSLLYIADYGNNRIVQFNMRNNQTILFFQSKINDIRNSYLRDPISIRFDDKSDSLIIAQQYSYNVVRWPIESDHWIFLAGSRNSDLNGTSRTLFNAICSINLDSFGSLYVVDCFNERIQYFVDGSPKGRTISGVIKARGTNPYLFNHPTSIAFDADLNYVVSDSLNARIQMFKRL